MGTVIAYQHRWLVDHTLRSTNAVGSHCHGNRILWNRFSHLCSVTCCVFAPSGWMLVTSATSGEVILFDVFAQRNIGRVLAHDLGVNSMHIAPPSAELGEEEVVLATGGNDNCVRLWKMQLGERKGEVTHTHLL